jgi:adenosylcobyric acid synthase
MAKAIMVQGTMSDAGKSIITAGLCRVFMQDGYRVAPFKSQNMALNSFITREGLEMGRAQAVQAQACKLEPSVQMNPILLKPTTDMSSQVILNGEVFGTLNAKEYYARKNEFLSAVIDAYNELAEQNDIVVIEGAGSPAEINLRKDDFVNMGMAKLAKAPVLLVGDIDRGGVFAQLAGTLMLLDEEDRNIVKAAIINKFRGDVGILRPGLDMIEERMNKPVAGVIPMLRVDIDDEDNPAGRIHSQLPAQIDIAVIRLPHISNFTDFAALEATKGISVRYVSSVRDLKQPDCVIIPGTKSTIADLKWLRQSGMEAVIKQLASRGIPLWGICGGYQMLGKYIADPESVEGGGAIMGMDLLPVETVFVTKKYRTRVSGVINAVPGIASGLAGAVVEGYEIHMGESKLLDGAQPLIALDNGIQDGCCAGNVCGTYLHGFFDSDQLRAEWFKLLCWIRGIDADEISTFDYKAYKECQFDLLADGIRNNLDMPLIYRILDAGI